MSWLEALFSVNGMSKKAFSVTLKGSTELLELENICRKYEGDKFPTRKHECSCGRAGHPAGGRFSYDSRQ